MSDEGVVNALRTAFVPPKPDAERRAAVLADAFSRQHAQPSASRVTTRRVAVLLLRAAALAVVGLAVLSVLPSLFDSPARSPERAVGPGGILQRALAAVAPPQGSVLHVVIESSSDWVPIETAPKDYRFKRSTTVTRKEAWIDPSGRRSRFFQEALPPMKGRTEGLSSGGVSVGLRGPAPDWGPWRDVPGRNRTWEAANVQDDIGSSEARVVNTGIALGIGVDDFFFDVDGYRKALKDGTARLEGTATVDGVPAYKLVIPPGKVSNLSYVVLVRASDYMPITVEYALGIMGAKPGAQFKTGEERKTIRFVTLEWVSRNRIPSDTWELPIPPGVFTTQSREMTTRDTVAEMQAMAKLGGFEPFSVSWLGEDFGGRKPISLHLNSLGGPLPPFPPYTTGLKPRYSKDKRLPAEDHVERAEPFLGLTKVAVAYTRKFDQRKGFESGPGSARVISYPRLAPSKWGSAAVVRPGSDSARSLAVGGRSAMLITRKLLPGTAHYLIVDFDDATVMLETFGWDEAGVLKAGESLQMLE